MHVTDKEKRVDTEAWCDALDQLDRATHEYALEVLRFRLAQRRLNEGTAVDMEISDD